MKMSSSWLERVSAQLIAQEGTHVSLDVIGEAIGLEVARPDEIEQLFQRLEQAGKTVGGTEGERLQPLLFRVLQAARQLRAEQERATSEAIAQRTGLSVREVRVALLYGEVLSRSSGAAG